MLAAFANTPLLCKLPSINKNRNHGQGLVGYVTLHAHTRLVLVVVVVPPALCDTMLIAFLSDDEESSSGSAPASPQIVARRGKFDDEEEENVSRPVLPLLPNTVILTQHVGP